MDTNIAGSSFKLLFAKIGRAGVTFGGILYFARHIGPTELGIFFMYQAALELLALPADLGLRGAVEKRISEGRERGGLLTAAVLLKVIPLAIVTTALVALKPVVNGYFGEPITSYLVIGLFLQEYGRLTIKVLNGEMRVGETAVVLLSQRIVWAGTGVVFVHMGYGTRGLVFGLILGFAVMLVWGLSKQSISFARPSWRHVRSLYEYARFNVVSQIGGTVYGWMDVAIIGFLLTPALVSAYEVSWRLSAFVVLFSHSLATSIFPQVSQWSTEDAMDRIEDLLPETVTWSLIPVIPAFVGTLVLSKDLLHYLFGPEYIVAWVALGILMGEKVLQAIHVVLGRSLLGIDRPDLAARATLVAVGLNLLLNFLLIPSLGIAGAALATATSFTVNTLLHARYLSQLVSIDIQYYDIGLCVAASIVMGIGLTLFTRDIAIDSLVMLLTAIAGGAAIYTTLILSSRPFRHRAKSLTRALL